MLVDWGEAVWGIPTERILSLKMGGHLSAEGQGSCKKFVKNSRIDEPDMLVRTRARPLVGLIGPRMLLVSTQSFPTRDSSSSPAALSGKGFHIRQTGKDRKL